MRLFLFLIVFLLEDFMSALSDIVAKLSADVAAKLAADKTALDAANAQIAALQAELADVPQAVTDLTTLDGTVTG